MPRVSIITATYNHEKFIGPCLESVLRQSYREWEVIIIDDGSTDGTADVIRGYSDPRIRYFFQENQGIDALAKTYNHALKLARGDLIAVLEGDDLWPQDKLTMLVPRFANPELVLAFGAASDIDTGGRRQSGTNRSNKWRRNLPYEVISNDPIGSATRFMLGGKGPSLIPAPTVLLRRSALERVCGFQSYPGLRTTDYPTYLRLSLEGKFHYEKRIMGFQRRHLDSVTSTNLESGHLYARLCAGDFARVYGEKFGFTGAEMLKIAGSWADLRPMVDFSLGRISLIKKDWPGARNHFRAAITSGEPLVRVASTAGWLTSWFHLDLEPLMRSAGRASLR